MRIFAVISILFVLGFADSDLLKIYERQGEKAVIEAMDKILESESFWEERLKNRDVTLGYYSKSKFLLLCEKSQKRLHLYQIVPKGFKKIDTIEVILGKNSGDKIKEGDLRTPVGVYRLSAKLTKVDDYYGPFAYETTYPNLFDRLQGKNGHGIWIHGMPSDCDDKKDTRGCIAMQNHRLKALEDLFDYTSSYLLISEDLFKKADKKDIVDILSTLYKWRNSWKASDYDRYISFYHKEFKRFDGSDLERFKRFKKRVFDSKKGQRIEIIFKDIEIIPYQNPQGAKLYRVNFFEIYDSDNYRFRGEKELYLKKADEGWKILVEK